MSEDDKNPVWYKPWWKALLIIVIFPVSLSYLIWKQKWPTPAKLVSIALIWIIFIGLGAGGNSSSDTEQQVDSGTTSDTQTPAPTAITYSKEQKQQEFKAFYPQYQKYVDDLLQFQTFMFGETTATNKGELYTALEQLKQNQDYYGSDDYQPEIPESLTENEHFRKAMNELKLANINFSSSISDMMKYVNKDNAKSYSNAQDNINRGEVRIGNSMDYIRDLAEELEINLELLETDS